MKIRIRHIVPLSTQALLLFDHQHQIAGQTDLVFHTPTHRGNGELQVMSNGCLSMLLRLGHGLYGVTDPFVQEIWRERHE